MAGGGLAGVRGRRGLPDPCLNPCALRRARRQVARLGALEPVGLPGPRLASSGHNANRTRSHDSPRCGPDSARTTTCNSVEPHCAAHLPTRCSAGAILGLLRLTVACRPAPIIAAWAAICMCVLHQPGQFEIAIGNASFPSQHCGQTPARRCSPGTAVGSALQR